MVPVHTVPMPSPGYVGIGPRVDFSCIVVLLGISDAPRNPTINYYTLTSTLTVSPNLFVVFLSGMIGYAIKIVLRTGTTSVLRMPGKTS